MFSEIFVCVSYGASGPPYTSIIFKNNRLKLIRIIKDGRKNKMADFGVNKHS